MTATVPPGSTRPALFGRADALARVEHGLREAAAGRGCVLWFSGEAGIGKSRLLAEAAEMTLRRGGRVLHGVGWEDPSTPPFWLWAQVLREAMGDQPSEGALAAWGPRAGAALALLPELAGEQTAHEAGAARFPLFDGVAAVLEALAETSPVTLLLDDLHWADPGSLRLLDFLFPTLSRRRVLVLAAWRDDEVPAASVLGSLAARVASRAEAVPLSGLDAEDVARLVLAHGGGEVNPVEAGRLRERTAGNPLFVAELTRLAHARGTTGVLSEVPPTARSIIQRRLARVSQPCHDLLAHLAVAGPVTSLQLLGRLTGLPPDEVAAAADEAASAHLVTGLPARVALTHPLVRDALLQLLPASRAREIHLTIAQVRLPELDADPAVAAEVAHHLRQALPLGDLDLAVVVGERAARVAYLAQAYEESSRQYEDVLTLLPPDDRRRPALLLGLGQARVAAGDHDRARAAYLDAADLCRATGDVEGLARAALGFGSGLAGFEVRLWDQAQLDLLDDALDRSSPTDSDLRAELMARLSVAVSFTERAGEGRRLAEEAVAMARRTGSSLTIARALAAHCDAIAGPTYSATREDEAGEVVRRARQAGDRELELLGLRLRVVALLEQGRVREARTDMRTFARVAERLRQPLYSWYVWLWRGFEAHLVGDLAELGRCAAEVDRLGALAESRNAATLAFVQRIWIALEERREAEIMAETSAVMPELTELVPDGGPLMGLAAGQPEEVRRRVRDRVEELLPFIPDDAEHVPNLCHLAHGLWYAREPARCAAPVYRALLPYADQLSIDGIAAGTHGSVARYLGVLAALQGRFDDAELHLEHALAANTAADASLALAHTRWMYAEVLALRDRPGGRERRQALLRQARDDYERMGIPQRVDLVTALLATDVGPAIPRDRPTPLSGIFRSSGAVWHLAYRGEEATLPHVKGMTDLAVLLARPGEEVHALDLVASPRTGRKAAADEGTPGRPGDLGEVLDATAREAYRRRLSELADELAEADTVGDAAAAERAAAEREALVRELSAAYGIGGRPRRAGDPAERARTTVTWRIRDAIRRIGAEHETLGRHLRSSVRTGVFCSYVPEQDQRWET